MRTICFTLSFTLLIYSCNFFDDATDLSKRIKELEFTRTSRFEKWAELAQQKNFNNFKIEYIKAIGKTRQPGLINLIMDILKEAKEDTVLSECIFAIGQMKTQEAEQILLELPFDQYSVRVQNDLLWALQHCATAKTIDFYFSQLENPGLHSAVLINAAICARKNLSLDEIWPKAVDTLSLKKPSRSLSYFLLNTAKPQDLSKLISIVDNSEALTQKYSLKKLSVIYQDDKKLLKELLQKDSLSVVQLKHSLKAIFNGLGVWENRYYALKLTPLLGDSTMITDLLSLSRDDHPQVRLAALSALAALDREQALSFLLNSFENEKQGYIKGEIIQILAEHFPQKAYPFIMQNLDKGDRLFKAQLLQALAKLHTALAHRTLKQFVNVDDPLLVNTAFEELRSLGLLTAAEVNHLLNSDDFSIVATALEYKMNKNEPVDQNQLLSIYKKFGYPAEFELQNMIVKATKTYKFDLNDDLLKSLFQFACHDVLRKRIIESHPKLSHDLALKNSLGFQLTPYLQPDSIIYFAKNPVVEMETDKGPIQIELFSQDAPLTVYNFLILCQMNFYNELIFHRVIPDFVIQGGDPRGDGWGGPNYLIPSEDNRRPFQRGCVGIATSGFDTGSSQFFICQSEQPHLNGNYTLFGQVRAGVEIIDLILPGDRIISTKRIE